MDLQVLSKKINFAFFQELEAKLEASRLREEKLVAEVESVRVPSTHTYRYEIGMILG